MSKYEPLRARLSAESMSFVPMKFSEIEALLGFPLPSSARSHRAWWSNNPSNNVMTKAWLAAGFETESVDLAGERLMFRRTGKTPGSPPPVPRPGEDSAPPPLSIIGILAGTVTLAPGTDLTAPLDGKWEAEA